MGWHCSLQGILPCTSCQHVPFWEATTMQIARSRDAKQRASASTRCTRALCSAIARWLPHRSGRLVGALSACALAAVASTAHTAQTVQVPSFGPNPGNLRMFKYVPDSLPVGAPLVVALHGCTQSATKFDDESGWTELADRLGFALLLPEQQHGNNERLCFNWFLPDHNRRGRGEAASIMAMVDAMKTGHGIDPKRIFVTGLSAGGAMTAVMLAAYPDVFRAGAIIAGIPYGCASTAGSAYLAMQRFWIVFWYGEGGWAAWQCGINLEGSVARSITMSRSPHTWRELLGEADGSRSTVWPKVSLWQGNDDRTVDPHNLVELMELWTAAHGVDQVPDHEENTPAYRHREYKDAGGDTKVETFEFPTLGHAVPVNPGAGPGTCGRVAPHFNHVAVCAASLITSFWGLSP